MCYWKFTFSYPGNIQFAINHSSTGGNKNGYRSAEGLVILWYQVMTEDYCHILMNIICKLQHIVNHMHMFEQFLHMVY